MNNDLFKEFHTVSAKQWKQKIQCDLKGASYNDTLIWHTNEDISVKPFYHSDDFKDYPPVSNTKATSWKIYESIHVTKVPNANKKANHAISQGVESIQFIIASPDISIQELIKNIDTKTVLLTFNLSFLSETYTKTILTIVPNAIINIDIIGGLAKTGSWLENLKSDFFSFQSVFNQTTSISINTTLYQNAGATIVQQLAYSLAHANEYLNLLEKVTNLDTIIFQVSVGTNYFFEIAKLRALRVLWASLARAYNLSENCKIMAFPTKRNKTIYDNHTNMLRTTTECMSAILGGANLVSNLPYDAIYRKDHEFGERISRNQLLILKHESYFNKVDNPADGAYYIERLTTQLAEKALTLFKNIESGGGYLKQLKDGTIQRKIKDSALKEQKLFNNQEDILVGTNKFPNPNDKMKEQLELYPFVKHNSRKTLIEPIIEKRLAEYLEQTRLKNEH
ncbi:methylmalonyl-CoA mutase subunit beta [Cognatitamlana onchidii]|uniref:methylmalonyl-CoA mutase subunit beta n=1 Tax=Cognatitamlana onchidii TaxID=2562860 RepID=UPI0010A68C20|nr:methylmalonyl-CoA mutase subunit beta [Algibacter onchidii]